MAITSLQQIRSHIAPRLVIGCNGNPGATVNVWNTSFGLSTFNGTMALSQITNGRVPDQSLAGFPLLPSFGGNQGFISRGFVNTQGGGPCIWRLYDRLFETGPFNFDANVTLASQPSFLSRIPGGTAADTAGDTEIWMEGLNVSTTGVLSVTVGYTNSAGTAGRSTGAVSFGAAAIARRMIYMPFQSGDTGVSQINTIVGSVASVGANVFNIVVLRRIASGRLLTPVINGGELLDIYRTCQIPFNDQSALFFVLNNAAGVNSQPPPHIDCEIVWG